MALSHSPQIVRDNLIFYIDAANPKSYSGTGTNINDLLNQNSFSTITNGPTFSTNNKGYFSFDGINDYLSIPPLFTGEPINYFTVSFWARFGTQGGWVINPNSGGVDHYCSYDTTFQRFRIFVIPAANSGAYAQSTPTNSVLPNIWYNITFSINNLDIKIHINGELSSSGTATAGYDEVWAGGWRWFARQTLQFPVIGDLGNILIYNEILTDIQIQQNFNALRGRYSI